tara:strand:- start:432 stop:548 length:117 start_codon:yes stop_codon:yes gene_type:complete
MMKMMFGFDGIAACSSEATVSEIKKTRNWWSFMRRGFG